MTGVSNGESARLSESKSAPAMVTFSHPPRVMATARTSREKRWLVLIIITVPLTLLIIDAPWTF